MGLERALAVGKRFVRKHFWLFVRTKRMYGTQFGGRTKPCSDTPELNSFTGRGSGWEGALDFETLFALGESLGSGDTSEASLIERQEPILLFLQRFGLDILTKPLHPIIHNYLTWILCKLFHLE